jgi:hypothetical protein
MTDQQEEYEQWLNDPVAQDEHQKWRIQDELKRSKLPDPFTTDTETFAKAFQNIFGVKHESSS